MAEPAVNTKLIKERLATLKGGRFKAWLEICAHCAYCADSCFFYTAHNKDPKYMPAYKVMQTLGKLYKKKGEVSREELEEMASIAYGDCTACRRCSLYCPFGIDMAVMIATARAILCGQGLAPKALMDAVKNYYEFGNQMAITEEEFIETCEWMEEEYAEEMPGLKIPVDKQGVDMMYTINAREAKFYPQDIGEVAQIFHAAGESWTMPSMGWDDTNLAMFAGEIKCAGHIVKLVYDAAEKLGVKKIGVTE
jgi:Fe-S oxidoreductase